MGKLRGSLPIEGSVGNLTFSKNATGIIVREKSGVTRRRVQHDPAFERTRENNAEFTAVASAGKLIRNAFRHPSFDTKNLDLRARLTRRLGKVLRTDLASARGQRSVAKGNLRLLEGFECSQVATVSQQLLQQYELSADTNAGTVTFQLDAFLPDCAFDLPEGTTGFKLSLLATYLDLDAGLFSAGHTVPDFIPFSHQPQGPLSLTLALSPLPGKPMIIALGLESFEQVNGYPCPLGKGVYNALGIVKVVMG